MTRIHLMTRRAFTLPVLCFALACSAGAPSETAETTDDAQLALHRRNKPITETHIHFWDVSRPIPWPTADYGNLYRTVLPEDYRAIAKAHNIVGANIVEASNVPGDNEWILDITAESERFFFSFAANLEIGSPTFDADLRALARDERVAGIRGFLWSPTLDPSNPAQIDDCKLLASYGMTLDIISRFGLNPEDDVAELAEKVPGLRIIIDHLGGARPDAVGWEEKMERLAAYPNIHMKFSSFFDIFNPSPTGDESVPWTAPTELDPYRPYFDVLMRTFGADRLIWGSNWPVVEQGGSIEGAIAIAEEYLAEHGPSVRNKVMHTNARKFYRRTKLHRGSR
jgi:predicted TIM-barrel fold metal-dependent hydrolase